MKNKNNKLGGGTIAVIILSCLFVAILILLLIIHFILPTRYIVGEDPYRDSPYYGPGEKKPIIYIYPEKDMNVSISVSRPENLTITYPKYEKGWEVKALTDGTLIDKNGKSYYALYWEGKQKNISKVKEDGFVIKGEETAEFLEEKLELLGLNYKEKNEFIMYWLPKLENNKYNYIRFETMEEMNENMELYITPKPDSLIRVRMDYKALDKKIKVKEQELTTPERTGYTVVEWGGVEI